MTAFAFIGPNVVAEGSWIIDDTGGDCELIGVWDPATLTCILSGNVFDTIEIASDGITLDGDGYTLSTETLTYGIKAIARSGITITNLAVNGFSNGIYFYTTSGSAVTGNSFSYNNIGIYMLSSSDGNTLSGNEFTDNFWAVFLHGSTGNTIGGNTFVGNDYAGIQISLADGNTVSGNTLSDNDILAITLYKSNGNTITGNTLSNNHYNINLEISDYNTISGNTATGGTLVGLYLKLSEGNTVSGNEAINNHFGFSMDDSTDNAIFGNTFSYNTYGIYVGGSPGNTLFHNNIVENTDQLWDDGSSNTWDNGEGEGNYWNDYLGEDLDGDGVGDTLLPHQTVDWYPLMSPWSPDPFEDIEKLKSYIYGLEIGKGIKNSLIKQLEAAENALSNGHEHTAVNILNAFINHVESLMEEQKLTEEQAQYMIASALKIIGLIEGTDSSP